MVTLREFLNIKWTKNEWENPASVILTDKKEGAPSRNFYIREIKENGYGDYQGYSIILTDKADDAPTLKTLCAPFTDFSTPQIHYDGLLSFCRELPSGLDTYSARINGKKQLIAKPMAAYSVAYTTGAEKDVYVTVMAGDERDAIDRAACLLPNEKIKDTMWAVFPEKYVLTANIPFEIPGCTHTRIPVSEARTAIKNQIALSEEERDRRLMVIKQKALMAPDNAKFGLPQIAYDCICTTLRQGGLLAKACEGAGIHESSRFFLDKRLNLIDYDIVTRIAAETDPDKALALLLDGEDERVFRPVDLNQYKNLVRAALDEALSHNVPVGSLLLKDIAELAHRLDYEDYCRRHDIRIEDLTPEDIERAALEKERESLDYAMDEFYEEDDHDR